MSRSAFRTVAFDFLSPAKPDPPLNTIHKPHQVPSAAADGPIAAFVQPPRSTRITGSCLALPPNTRRFSCLYCLYWALRWCTVGRTFLLLALLAACLSYTVPLPVPAYARSSASEVVLMLISGTAVTTIDRLVCSYYLVLYYSISLFAKFYSCRSFFVHLCVNHLLFLA